MEGGGRGGVSSVPKKKIRRHMKNSRPDTPLGPGIGAEFKRTTKSEDENEHEKEALCKMGGIDPFYKMAPFRLHFQVIFGFHFLKK